LIIRNRKAFIGVIVVVSFLKILLSALSPPSLELIDIVRLFYSQQPPLGPWVAVYPPLLGNWTAREGIQAWLQAPGMATDLNAMNLSFLFRFPVFLFDLGTAYLLCVIGARLGTPTKARLAALIWFLNPYSFFSIELAAVPDVVAVFLVMLSLSLIMSRRLFWTAATLCLAIWFKLFPLILLPPLFLYISTQGYSRRSLGAALVISILGLFGYLGWVLPGSKYLFEYTPVTQPMAFLVGTPYIVSVSAFGIILFYGVLVLFARKNILIPTLISTIMVYYALSNPSPQYFLWALPLIALDLKFVSPSRVLVATTFYVLAFAMVFRFHSDNHYKRLRSVCVPCNLEQRSVTSA
jgi:hypothetical protein